MTRRDPEKADAPAELVTLAQARLRLGGISPQTLYRLVADGELVLVKLRRRSFVIAGDLERLIERSSRRGRS
jgi:hypothetical protein